jgi:hypothetical protein
MKRTVKQGVHYLVWATGSGDSCYEWVSRETGTTKQWIGPKWDFLILWGDDLTVLPTDYVNVGA